MSAQILVVEDEQIIAKDIQRTLQGLGYTVPATVATGQAALDKTAELRPDLVLMDIQLRGEMDGIAAASTIRERWDIPVIYLTSHADSATLERAKIAEPFGYVLKPFDERDLHTTIEMALYKFKIDRKLRENERWLSVTLNSIGDGVVATDANGCVVFINPVAQRLTAWTSEAAIGRPLGEVFRIVNERTREPVPDPVAIVLSTGTTVGLANHTVLIARDGTEWPIDDSGAPIMAPDGTILGAVLVFREIAERRRLEDALQQCAAELAEADRRKDSFIAMLGHELRNPLAGIVTGIEVLGRLKLPEGDAAKMLSIISRQTVQIRRLIDDLLDVTRVTHGKIAVNKAPLDIVQLVRQTADDHRQFIEAKGALLRFDLPDAPIYCEGDHARLSQVMTNLLTNAAKFQSGSGEVAVSVRRSDDRQPRAHRREGSRHRNGWRNIAKHLPTVRASQAKRWPKRRWPWSGTRLGSRTRGTPRRAGHRCQRRHRKRLGVCRRASREYEVAAGCERRNGSNPASAAAATRIDYRRQRRCYSHAEMDAGTCGP